jgi:superfamily I DNA/RNA helicase
MLRQIDPAAWTPAGGLELEPEALRAVQSKSNGYVVAGPGAGKTELLAQRACFLFQTRMCAPPHRILAISYKRDAAKNLRDRVDARLGGELARYFDSLTFDAFSKGLLDRFLLAVPPSFRPTSDYQIDFTIKSKMGDWLQSVATDVNRLTIADVSQIAADDFYLDHFVAARLGVPWEETIAGRAGAALWRAHLSARPSRLEFAMIGRLVDLLLRENPKLRKAVQDTYSHVLLDEFQDTTGVQYDLLITAFHGSHCVLTAVGDGKQRIMGFAGAMPTIFARFANDFAATPYQLTMNYRSAPELVRIQRVIIEALEPGTPPALARPGLPPGSGECVVHIFSDYRQEAEVMAEFIDQWIHRDGLRPRDICLLAREKPGNYAHLLVETLQRRGVRARDEMQLQDLLTEPLTQTVIALLRLALQERHLASWDAATGLLDQIHGLMDDAPRTRKLVIELETFSRTLGEALRTGGADSESIRGHVRSVMSFFGEKAFKRVCPQYLQGDFFENTSGQIATSLADSRLRSGDWVKALDDLIGEDAVPIMTVHKSKGLEYHTVIFLGLEDAAFRDFATKPEDERRAFFVAFSRAKQRVLFTFCEMRAKRSGDYPAKQSMGTIRSLYDLLLTDARVPSVDHRPAKDHKKSI